MARHLLCLLVLLSCTATVLCQACPNNDQQLRIAEVDGAAATYTGADVEADFVNNFAFTTPAATEGIVYSLQLHMSADVSLCPAFPLVFLAEECPCDATANCDATMADAAPSVTSGLYMGAQSVFIDANAMEELYPMLPSTTYYVAFWLIAGCPLQASSTISLSVTTQPITTGTEGVLIQDMPFYASASGDIEALAFLSLPTESKNTELLDGVQLTLAPTGPDASEDDFLDCVYFSDEQAALVESNWWTSYSCNPDYNRNAFSFVVELPGNLGEVPTVALDIAMAVRSPGTYNVTYNFDYSCGDCGTNSLCDGSTGTCFCTPGWAVDAITLKCTVAIDCHGNTTVPCYIEDGTATKTCNGSLWGPCTLIECDSGFVETAWNDTDTNVTTTQCLAESVAGPGLTILWICLGIVLLCAIYGAVGAAVYFYQRHKRLGKAVKTYDIEEEYDSTVY